MSDSEHKVKLELEVVPLMDNSDLYAAIHRTTADLRNTTNEKTKAILHKHLRKLFELELSRAAILNVFDGELVNDE